MNDIPSNLEHQPDPLEETLPAGYYLRPVVLEDAPAINALIRAYDLRMTGEAFHSEVELLQEWQRPDFHLDQDARVVVAPSGETEAPQIVGYQEIWNRSEHILLSGDGYVHPDFNGQGIGTTMLRWLEQRARQHIPLAAAEKRVVIRNGVDGIDPDAFDLHENEGYHIVRYFWHMEIRLESQPPEPTWPPAAGLRIFQPEQEVRDVFDALEEAFRDHWGYTPWDYDNWRRRACSEEYFDPSLWFLAVSGEQIAGAAVCRLLDENIGWVSQLGVRPAWRRAGLGLALLESAFAEFYSRGITLIRLGVDAQNPTGATRLYEKAGMNVSHRFVVFEKELRPGMDDMDESG